MLPQMFPVKVPVKVVGALMAVLTAKVRAGPKTQLFRACTDIFPPANVEEEAKLTVMLVVPWPPVIVAPAGTVHT